MPNLHNESIYNSSPRVNIGQMIGPQVDGTPQKNEYDEKYWCKPFSVNDLEDFQTETEGIISPSKLKQQRKYSHDQEEHQWFEPGPSNNDKLITRVIVNQNAQDNNATLLIIFDEPAYEEYKIVNETNTNIEYCKQDEKGKKLCDWISIDKETHASFVWDTREILSKRIKINICSHEIVIQIDKCSESDNEKKPIKNSLFVSESIEYCSTIQQTAEGTKLVTISQNEKKRANTVAQFLGGIGSMNVLQSS